MSATFPASPAPAYYSVVTTPQRNNIFYQSDLNAAGPAGGTGIFSKVGSVPIKAG